MPPGGVEVDRVARVVRHGVGEVERDAELLGAAGRAARCTARPWARCWWCRAASAGARLLAAGGVLAARVGDQRRAERLVEGGPVADPVAERLVHRDRVVEEALRGVAVRPAAGLLDRLRQIPVVEGEPGQDAVLEQFVDESAVEVDARRVRPDRRRLDARPAHREAVGVEAEALHERDVLRHAVVVVDRGFRLSPSAMLPGVRAKWSQMESSLPSSWLAPSIWAAAVAAPQMNPAGQ